ncbi:MAG: type II secretion system F family protein [Gammaproteobacteria bacterium]|uniref:Type II secretion system F family protein n=1 Tax=Candidatus Thiopontia autotrophica TaxID=2841688 RepID=A0A8J6PAX1_9GAMM|nr:type II secretion system F family protein [Candidatus Thiopontia autotrophica]
MARYYWRGVRESGGAVRGQLRAGSRSHAIEKLGAMGITHKLLLPLPNLQPSLSSTQITLLIRQLSTLLSSGLTLARSLEGIIQGLADGPLRTLSEDILLELQQGSPFSRILAQRPEHFDPFLIHLITSGEATGQLSTLLARAAEYRERTRALRRQLWKALSYPLGVFIFTLAISLFLLLQIVPQFEILFNNLGGALPPLTRHILDAAHFLDHNLGEIIVALLLLVTFITMLYSRVPRFKFKMDQLLLSIPLLGTTIREVMVARLSRTLATLQEAAIPTHIGLDTSTRMTHNLPLRRAIQNAHSLVLQGVTLSNALAEQGLFPPVAIQMIRAGEDSGELSQMLNRLALYYEDEVEHRVEQLTTILEPLLILLIGGMVGVLAIALYQPIFQIGHHF